MEQDSQYRIGQTVISLANPSLQKVLASAYTNDIKPYCLCTPEGVEMYIARYNEFVIKRMPETGDKHHPTCLSYEQPMGQSGLGEIMGEAVFERAASQIEVRLDFPLTRRLGRAPTPGEASPKTEVTAERRRIGIKALLHLLWDRAGLTRWYPRMAGKRSWWVVRRHLLDVANDIQTKGMRLSERLYIPEPFQKECAHDIARRRTQAFAQLLSPGEDVQFKMMILIGELKDFSQAEIDYRITLKHMADCPVYMETKAAERFKSNFTREYESWAHARSIAAASPGQMMRFIFAGLIYAKRETIFYVDKATLMLASANWIPLDYPYENPLVEELTRQNRRYLKPLRYESKKGASFPNLVLLDTGSAPVALDILSPFMPQKELDQKQSALKQRPTSWLWNLEDSALPPELPPAFHSRPPIISPKPSPADHFPS